MNYLLDTHIWLWMLHDSSRLGPAAGAAVKDAQSTLHLSAASVWEIAIKVGRGRLALPDPIADFIPDRLRQTSTLALSISPDHAAHVARLPDHHRDPFDRLLVAQAQLEGLTLITADPALSAYDVPLLLVEGSKPKAGG